MRRLAALFVVALFSLAPVAARAEVRLPKLFSDHMVLQREKAAPIWGWAGPGEAVTVTLGDRTEKTTADAEGRWRVALQDLAAGGPHVLRVAGKNTIEINDVLVGEVWLGSGQSNMAMTVDRSNDVERETQASDLPQVRVFTVGGNASSMPQDDCNGSWVVCTPTTAGRFSATAFFCGRELHQKLKVPVGLIVSAVGGTPIESWIDADAQRADPKLAGFFAMRTKADAEFDPVRAKQIYEKQLADWKVKAAAAKKAGKTAGRAPRDPIALRERKGDVGGLFNGKIAPLVGYGLRGALWYQGEANSVPEKAEFYEAQLRLLVTDWRRRWNDEFPFAWVQLPNFASGRSGWVVVREGMQKTLALPKTGMAVTIDVGDLHDIHPKNKQAVGHRLALWALATVYGEKVEYLGPTVAGHDVRDGAVVVRFEHADGLAARDGELRGFEVAGADKEWRPATARVDGSSLVVSSAEVKKPVVVRYAWKDDTDANLVNSAGLPASPFRTADF